MVVKLPKNEKRTIEQVKEHYELEKQLASQLQTADRNDRKRLYTELYNQLFRSIPHHPQLSRKQDDLESTKEVFQKMKLLERFLNPSSIFLEVGVGDCQLSFEVAKHVKKVYGIDVSAEIADHEVYPHNFDLIISDGCTIPVPANTVTVAYSNQLMEHLHTEDARDQLYNLYQALAPNGVYICVTPNRLAGPHDISRYFDEVATGFHLREYTNTELRDLFFEVGFSKVETYAGGKGVYLRSPFPLVEFCELMLCTLPFSTRKMIANMLPMKALLGAILVARK